MLKWMIVSCLSLCCLMACSQFGPQKEGKTKQGTQAGPTNKAKRAEAKFEFSKEIHKFGAVTEGEILVCNFYYKNTGTENLIITSVETSCGCTAVKWDKKPLAPGDEGKISVEFNSAGRYGKQYKTVSIFANVPEKVKELIITAEVN